MPPRPRDVGGCRAGAARSSFGDWLYRRQRWLLPVLLALVSASASGAQQSPPIIVKLVEPYKDPTGIADVVIGSLGLAGAMALLAVVCGLLTAGVLFFLRSRHPLQ
jgi:hypothetical protein